MKRKRQDRRLVKEAERFLKETKKLLRRGRGKVPSEHLLAIENAAEAVWAASGADKSEQELNDALKKLDVLVDQHLAPFRKSSIREYIESIGVAVLVALLIRAFLIEAFKIPSGSMLPTLHVGDQIFVNKYIYGVRLPFTRFKLAEFSEPSRGDVIVFMYPSDPGKDFIKRVVGIPGDTIELKKNVLYVNGVEQPRFDTGGLFVWDRNDFDQWQRQEGRSFEETIDGKVHQVLQNGFMRPTDYGPIKVQPRHVFVMGDNRDNSHDSRRWCIDGNSTACQVPYENILGRAMFIWWAWGHEGLDAGRFFMWVE